VGSEAAGQKPERHNGSQWIEEKKYEGSNCDGDDGVVADDAGRQRGDRHQCRGYSRGATTTTNQTTTNSTTSTNVTTSTSTNTTTKT
jgi:hypothetical protein